MLRAAGLVMALLASSPAWAVETWMWGVGPKVGTMILPGTYPIKLPKAVVDDGAIQKVGGDLVTGLKAVYHASPSLRLGLDGTVDIGNGFLATDGILTVERAYSAQAMDFLVGGGVGVGSMKFEADAAELSFPYYPIRGSASALIRDGSRGYQGTIFAQVDVPSGTKFIDSHGANVEASGGIYGALGVEVSVLFGDFEPPRRAKREKP